ncbi:T9SS type A sorting domain-containing protein [Flavobacterium sp. LMO8]|uniref:T9SS type A sorting domain-containing protein n=1 Tax=Flavobacterium sp. LMO8 TaxID=2654244 RepID=UPI001290B8FD|nr:T9SS type A sorting domain-containing protein [Flavobacterium sp. LMO8]MQP24342.1 T9SS type A sorting domain-containing protein [Flavobacterium sp. LMO8]
MSTNFSGQSGSILVQQTNQGQVGAGSLICDYVIIDDQPSDRTFNVNGATSFSVSTLNASSYRWQMSIDGANWTDLSDGGTMPGISGAFTNTLNLTNVPSTYDGYYFRVSSSNAGDSVYSKISQLNSTLSQSNFDNELFSVYYDINSDAIVIQNNDETLAKFSYKLYDLNGRVLATGEIDSQIRNLSTSNYQSGVYLLEVFDQDKRLIKKIIKN